MIQIRSPKNDRESIEVPKAMANLQKAFNGTVCSKTGDEFKISQNILDLLEDTPIESSMAQLTNHWKLTATMYEDLWRTKALSLMSGEDFPIVEEQRLLIEWIMPKAGGVYLDAGCSTALYSRALLKHQEQAQVVALDFSMEMLQEARRRSIADSIQPYLFRADASQLPFFTDSFDGIVCGGTLNELYNPTKVLHEFRRVIKADGEVFMMYLLKADSWYGKLLQEPIKLGGIKFWTKDESNELFEQAGFNVSRQIVRGIVCFAKLVSA